MNHPFTYVGCFVDPGKFRSAISHIRRGPLEEDIRHPHVTFAYRPEQVDQSLFGERVHITVVGYGNDGQNEGLKVRLRADSPAVQSMIDRIEVPHITIAVSGGGQPVNTRYLSFYDVEPIELEGEYGGYSKCVGVVVGNRSG